MRICFVSRRYFPAISGMSIYAANLLRELAGQGHDVTMISQYRGDAFGRGVYGGGPPPLVGGVRVIGLEAHGEQDGGDFERDIDTMIAAITTEHARAPFDMLHAQYGYPTGWAVLLAAARLQVPCVVSIQGGDGHWVGSCCDTHRVAMQRVLDLSGAVLIGGASFADEVHQRLGTAFDRFTIVPGAVDTTHFYPVSEGGDTTPARAKRATRLLYHGRVDQRKGVLDFLTALRAVHRGWSATISGVGPDLDAAKALTDALGLRERVAFTGYADYADVPAIYRVNDVFVSPTYAEGFSNTILEAMASGLAVVSCRSVGVVDCLRDGDNGVLVEAGDVAALAAALTAVIQDRALREQLAATALEECRRVYSWTAVARQIAAVYDRLQGTTPALVETALPVADCRFRREPHLL